MGWGSRIDVRPEFCILWAWLLLVLPLRFLAAAVTAAVFHELCHWAVIRCFRGKIHSLRVGAGGMVMETGPLSAWQELLCALAGPGGSLLLAGFGGCFPALALWGWIQGMFNLLPVYPLDGGRALQCLLRLLFPNRWEVIQTAVEILVLALLLAAALASGLGMGPMLLWGMLAMRKIPCKDGSFGVQ